MGKRWSPARRLEHVGREVRELDRRMGRQRAELTRLNAAVADSASARDALAAEHAAAQGGAAGQLQARPAAASLQRRRPCSRSRSWLTACCCKQKCYWQNSRWPCWMQKRVNGFKRVLPG